MCWSAPFCLADPSPVLDFKRLSVCAEIGGRGYMQLFSNRTRYLPGGFWKGFSGGLDWGGGL